MTQIFISYAHKDGEELAENLHERLTGCGYKVWKDSYDLAVGEDFPSALSKAIEDADKVIILLSPAALKSKWVSAEINMAMTASQHKILPVVLKKVINKQIDLLLRRKNYLTMTDINDWEALNKLVIGLKSRKKIPRVYSMSKQTDTKYEGVLLLKRSELASATPRNRKDLKKVAKAMWMEYLFISRKIPELGIVPPGFAPLASAITAYLAGRPNQLPRLYYPETGSNGKFRVSADVFIELQRLRKQAQSIK